MKVQIKLATVQLNLLEPELLEPGRNLIKRYWFHVTKRKFIISRNVSILKAKLMHRGSAKLCSTRETTEVKHSNTSDTKGDGSC